MTAQDQINTLNSKVRTCLAPSKIAGIGLFALRDIPKGTKLDADATPTVYALTYAQTNKLFPEIRAQILGQWPQIVNGSRFAYPTVRLQAYINHSDEPNYNPFTDEVTKDIAKDEEITEDYRLIPGHEQAHPWLTEKPVVSLS